MMRTWVWRPVALGLGIALLAMAVRTIAGFLPSRVYGNDFSMAYLASHALSQGQNPYTLSLTEYARQQGVPATEVIPQATNPPLLLWVLRPLGELPPEVAFWCYIGIEVTALVIVFAVAVRFLGRQFSPASWCLAGGLVCYSMPLFTHFWFSQVQLPLLAVVMVAVLTLRTGRPWIACVLFTLAAVLKLYPAPLMLMPALAARGRQRGLLLGWTMLCVLIWVMLPGVRLWQSFWHHGLPLLREMAGGRYCNFTVASFLPLPAAVLVNAALVGLAWWTFARRPGDASFCLMLVTAVMCSLVAWVHYLIWMFYPLCFVAVQTQRATGRRRFWLMVLLVSSVLVFNVAGSNPFSFSNRGAQLVNAGLPLLLMTFLYIYFLCTPESLP